MIRPHAADDDGWRDYDHGFRDGYQAALREVVPVPIDVAEIYVVMSPEPDSELLGASHSRAAAAKLAQETGARVEMAKLAGGTI